MQNYKAPRRALRKALPAAESPHPETTRERLAYVLLLGYKRGLSPLLHAGAFTQCKHLPTCSEYAFVAVVRHGCIEIPMRAEPVPAAASGAVRTTARFCC